MPLCFLYSIGGNMESFISRIGGKRAAKAGQSKPYRELIIKNYLSFRKNKKGTVYTVPFSKRTIIRPVTQYGFSWCERRDLNPHGSYSASTSSWCVCRFRHPRIFTDTTCKCKDYYSIAENTCQGIAHKILRHHQSFPKRLLRPPPHNIKWWGNAGLSHKIPLGEDN